LKLQVLAPHPVRAVAFRATSKRTRIETTLIIVARSSGADLSEQHPREQGLKLHSPEFDDLPSKLSEQHPREQGLKPLQIPDS